MKMGLSKAEKRQLKKEKLRKEREEKEASRKRKKIITRTAISIVVLFVIASVSLWAYNNSQRPGYYDNFARCLAEKGAVIYGADWCQYTAAQKQMFGKSFQYLNYKDYTETTGIKTTPTWEYDGERHPKVQSMESLSKMTGCPLPQQQQ